MTTIFRKDRDRQSAAALKRLMMRLNAGEGADGDLGADIVYAVGETPAVIGNPTSCIDCALSLCLKLNFSRLDALLAATRTLRERSREGWKPIENIDEADVARAITGAIVKSHIARLEAAPV